MKVCLVCYEDVDRWILGKFAKKMQYYLEKHEIDVSISKTGNSDADINHHIIYSNYIHVPGSVNTMMITHVDNLSKLEILKKNIQLADLGIAMSKDTANMLYTCGIQKEKLSYVLPAHDSIGCFKKIRIGITCRVQEDGRKREYFLNKLAEILNPNIFEFEIMGDNWESQIKTFQKYNFSVNYYKEFEYIKYHEIINTIDYYLYMGHDEGQMGFVDAVCAQKKIITTPQGYHSHFIELIDYPFNTFEELVDIFKKIELQQEQREIVVNEWNWENYTIKHLDLWKKILNRTQVIDYVNSIYKTKDGILSQIEKTSSSKFDILLFKIKLFFSQISHIYYIKKKKIIK